MDVPRSDGPSTSEASSQYDQQSLVYSKRHRVFVGGISNTATEKSLGDFFQVFGNVVECKIVMDAETNRSKGYAFVTYESEEVAERVRNCGLLYFMGKLMNTGEAQRSMRVRPKDAQQQQQTNAYRDGAGQ